MECDQRLLTIRPTRAERKLRKLNVPIADLAPSKRIQRLRRLVEFEVFETFFDGRNRFLKARQDPSVRRKKLRVVVEKPLTGSALRFSQRRGIRNQAVYRTLRIELQVQEFDRVPNLVTEGAIAFHSVHRKLDVASLARHRSQGEAKRIGSVLIDQNQGVDHVPLGLRHLLAFFIPHHGVQVNFSERHFTHEVHSHHDHPSDPEEDDVKARLQNRSGVKSLQGFGLLRPAQRRERPERRTKPGIQDIFILFELRSAAMRALLGSRARNGGLLAALAIPSRNLVSPPKLARNAPVADVVHPLEISFLPALRRKLDFTGFHSRNRGLSQRLNLHKPLFGDNGLGHLIAALAKAHFVLVIFGLHQLAGFLQRLKHGFACFAELHAGIRAARCGDFSVLAHDVYNRQVMAFAQFVVVEVVRRRYFQATRSELTVHVGIGDDRNFSPEQRQNSELAVSKSPAFVLRMHGHSRIAQQRLRTRGGNHQRSVFARCRIFHRRAIGLNDSVTQVPEVAFSILWNHFQVRERGLTARAPVDDALPAVNESVLVEAHKHFSHSRRKPFIHREAFTLPIQG